MGWLSNALAAVAPGAAARRERAHAERAVASAQRRYAESWARNDPAVRRMERLANKPLSRDDRARIRDIMETNPFAVKLLQSLLNDLIGWGITGVPKANKRLVDEWKQWLPLCDMDGVLDLYGLQELIARTMLVDGEVFIVRYVEIKSQVNPLRLQVHDADMLDLLARNISEGHRFRDGIEYDAFNRPVAYHFRQSKEFDQVGVSRRIEAEHVIHLFLRTTPGQRRGRSVFEALLDPVDEMNGYIEAETMRKRIEACFTAFITPGETDPEGDIGDVTEGFDGAPDTEALSPGMMVRLRGGETVSFAEPKALGGMSEFLRWGGLRVAAAGGVTYEDTTGDLSHVNFSSFKAGALNKKRYVGRLQFLHIIPRCLMPIWSWWTEAHALTGRGAGLSRATIEWTPPPFESIDRVKEAQADALEIANRTNSRRKVVTAAGYDYDELQDEIAADRKQDAVRGLPEPAVPGASTQPTEQGAENGKPD